MKLNAACLVPLAGLTLCSPAIVPRAASNETIPYPNHPIIEFPLRTWAENLAVRSNGHILLTILNTPQLVQVDPLSLQPPILIHQFPNPDGMDGLIGIVEMEHDIFYAIHGNFNISDTRGTPGTYSIWKIDLNLFQTGQNGTITSPALVNELLKISETLLPNSIIPLSKPQNQVLISDSRLGGIWKLDLNTLAYEVVIKDPLMDPTANPSFLGVNGIKVYNHDLYFTNTQAGTLNRVPIDLANGSAIGPAEILQQGLFTADDLILDSVGDVYVAQDAGNVLVKVAATSGGGWETQTLVGARNDTYLAGATAVQFGRTKLDRDVLYVSTNGGQAIPVDGKVANGKVVAVNTETVAAEGS